MTPMLVGVHLVSGYQSSASSNCPLAWDVMPSWVRGRHRRDDHRRVGDRPALGAARLNGALFGHRPPHQMGMRGCRWDRVIPTHTGWPRRCTGSQRADHHISSLLWGIDPGRLGQTYRLALARGTGRLAAVQGLAQAGGSLCC